MRESSSRSDQAAVGSDAADCIPLSFRRDPPMRTPPRLISAAVVLVLGVLVRSHVMGAAASAGAISGRVTFTGTPPKMKPIDMAKEPACVKEHPTPITTETVVTGPGNSLRWVVVYIAAGEQGSAAPAAATRYDQKACQYIPHVVALQVN